MFARNLKNMRMHLLLDGNGLGQVAGEVDIEVAGDGEPVGNELQRNDIEETLENIDGAGDLNLLSLHDVKKKVAELSGIEPIRTDMCINTCMAFTGPFADLETCPLCDHPRYNPMKGTRGEKVANQTFAMLPVGPQIQAMWRTRDGAQKI